MEELTDKRVTVIFNLVVMRTRLYCKYPAVICLLFKESLQAGTFFILEIEQIHEQDSKVIIPYNT